MADPRKKPNDKDSKAKSKKPPEPDLELSQDADAIDDEILEILDSVEEDDPVVEAAADDDVDEVVEVVEEVDDDDDQIPAKPGKKSPPTKAADKKKAPPTEDEVDFEVVEAVESGSNIANNILSESVDDEEPVLVELASDVDLGQMIDEPRAKQSASDIITEALESGVELGSGAKDKPAAAARSSSDSDIDLDSILGESEESSAVDLDGSGKKRALSLSDSVETKQHSDEAIEISDDLLIESPGAKKDDAVLVKPKQKAVSNADVDLDADLAADLRSLADQKAREAEEVVDADEVVSLASDDVVADESKPPSRGRKGREPELVGAGAGSSRRRGGFMPFLLGLLAAVLLIGGGGAAAWYFDMLPKSPTAQQALPPRPKQPLQPGIAKSVEEFNLLVAQKEQSDRELSELREALATAKIPADPKTLPEHLNTLIAAKNVAPDKGSEAIIAELNAAKKQVAALKDQQAAAEKETKVTRDLLAKNESLLNDAKAIQATQGKTIAALEAAKKNSQDTVDRLNAEIAKLAASDKEGLITQLAAAKKEHEVAKNALTAALKQQDALNDSHKAAQQALEAAKSELTEATKVRETLQAAFETAKAELEKARAGDPAPVVTDLSIADSLIKQPDPKSQGQGYIILGASQTRSGKSAEGLNNILKGLKMVDPQLALHDPDAPAAKQPSTVIAKAPTVPPPAVVVAVNPLAAEKLYTKGLELYWARNYASAEAQFSKAISSFHDDARFHYFLGLSRYMQGSTQKRQQAHVDFQKGVQLEMSHHPGAVEVNASLERIQGELRTMLNGYRERQARQ